MNAKHLIGPMRPNFLTLTPACIFLGYAASVADSGFAVSIADAVIVLAGALLAHASVNLLNEYEDFRSGLDFNTVRTPFSGGSGTLPIHPSIAAPTLWTGVAALAGTGVIGLYLVAQSGIGLLPIGLLGLLIIASYTTWITRRPLICLLAPGLAFGPLMVTGTVYVLTGGYTATGLLVSLTPLFLVSGLLLINQFPDLEPDQNAGRRHLPIAVGRRAAARVFAGMLLAAFLPIAAGVGSGLLPPWALLGLLPLPLAFHVARGALRHAEDAARLTPYLGLNVAVIMSTIMALGAGLLLG